MEIKLERKEYLASLLGIIINGISVSLSVKANLGISPVSSFPYVLSQAFPFLSLGVWNILFQAALLLIILVVVGKPLRNLVISMVLSFVFGGVLDLFKILFPFEVTSLAMSVGIYVVSVILLSIGASLLLISKAPILPVDSFVRDMTGHFNKPVKAYKTTFDIVSVSGSIVVSLLVLKHLDGVGVGTVISALTIGSLMHHFGIPIAEKIKANLP